MSTYKKDNKVCYDDDKANSDRLSVVSGYGTSEDDGMTFRDRDMNPDQLNENKPWWETDAEEHFSPKEDDHGRSLEKIHEAVDKLAQQQKKAEKPKEAEKAKKKEKAKKAKKKKSRLFK